MGKSIQYCVDTICQNFVQGWALRSWWMDIWWDRRSQKAVSNLDRRGVLFSHECHPASFADGLAVPRRGPDDVVGPIVDGFTSAGREAAGLFVSGCTGAFWDAEEGAAVLPPEAFARLLKLARQ